MPWHQTADRHSWQVDGEHSGAAVKGPDILLRRETKTKLKGVGILVEKASLSYFFTYAEDPRPVNRL